MFSQTVARFGGQENAFTSTDYTGYFQRVARDHLQRLMEFEADRMTGLMLDGRAVLPERDVVLEEHNQRVDEQPGARMLGEQMQAALFLNHPYGRPMIGWRHEIEKLNREDALEFYQALLHAEQRDPGRRRRRRRPTRCGKLAEETYGKVAQRAEIGPRVRPQEPPQIAPRTVTLADPRVAPAEPAAHTTWCRRTSRRRPARPRRWTC